MKNSEMTTENTKKKGNCETLPNNENSKKRYKKRKRSKMTSAEKQVFLTNKFQSHFNELVQLLQETTTSIWKMPWTKNFGLQQSVRGFIYNNSNQWLLTLIAQKRGYSSNKWITAGECNKRGGSIIKGEKGTSIIKMFAKTWKEKVDDTDLETGEDIEVEKERKKYVKSYEIIFNVDQTTLSDDAFKTVQPAQILTVPDAEAIIASYTDCLSIIHEGVKAAYSPSADVVKMPPKKLFKSTADYYCTLFHELGHSTGHATRLNRKGITNFDRFGSHQYSVEELVAEITASYLAKEAGISENTFDNSVVYTKGWLDEIPKDTKVEDLYWAFHQAEKAACYIMKNQTATKATA